MIFEEGTFLIQDFLANRDKSINKTGFIIGTTSHYSHDSDFYLTPTRQSKVISLMGVIVKNVETAKKFAHYLDDHVDYIFVDCEKKIETINYGANDVGNIEKAVYSVIKKAKMVPFKGNDLTFQSADSLLRILAPNFTGGKVAIIGSGNLSMKIGLSLLERGNSVTIYSRNLLRAQKIAEVLNAIKFRTVQSSCTATNEIRDAFLDSAIAVVATHHKNLIGEDLINLMNHNGLEFGSILVDVGKGGFTQEVIQKWNIHRIDIEDEITNEIEKLLVKFNSMKLRSKRMLLQGKYLVKKGIVGSVGDIIVDDPDNPRRIIGVCDGNGNLNQINSSETFELLAKISSHK